MNADAEDASDDNDEEDERSESSMPMKSDTPSDSEWGLLCEAKLTVLQSKQMQSADRCADSALT